MITGGAGFVGSNLAEVLVEKGHEVVVLDNFFLGSEKNLEKVKKDVTIVKGDVRNKELVMKVSKKMDFIFHEAAASSSPMFRDNLAETMEININGTINVLEAARQNSVKRVVYASTSSLYGSNPAPLKEDMALRPVNFYASSKLMKEHLAGLFGVEFGVETVGLRFGSVYGPHEESKGIYANLVSQFLWAIKKGEKPVVYGNGRQKRDFIYVKDICQAHILAAAAKKKMLGEIFNVATGKTTTFNEMISTLSAVTGIKTKTKFVRNPVKNYIYDQGLDITKITSVLGYKPEYTLKEGVEKLADS